MTAYYELRNKGWIQGRGTISAWPWRINQLSVITISTFFFPKQNNLPECMGSPVSIVPARMYHPGPAQQQVFHTWTFNLSLSWNNSSLPSHQMMTIIVFLSPLKSPITLKSDDPTHLELGDHVEWGLNVYDLIYARKILIIRNSPHSWRKCHTRINQTRSYTVSSKNYRRICCHSFPALFWRFGEGYLRAT